MSEVAEKENMVSSKRFQLFRFVGLCIPESHVKPSELFLTQHTLLVDDDHTGLAQTVFNCCLVCAIELTPSRVLERQ